jgi:hypothetical protein
LWAAAVALLFCWAQVPLPSLAQAQGTWEPGTEGQEPPQANTTVVPRAPGAGKTGQGEIIMNAYLTDNSPPIAKGLVWRVFRDQAGPGGKPALVSTHREASPTLKLDPGDYHINVALGRAYLTRKIAVAADRTTKERFVLNAGGLRVIPALASGEPANEKVTFDVESNDRDEFGQRMKVVTGVKTGVVLRLNAGIYGLVSTYGDANAVTRADVTVEAGKLSDVTLTYSAAKVSFRLVTRGGGEAIADTQWAITNDHGDPVKESSGALPTHFLAPGAYAVRATHAGRSYGRDFTVKSGDNVLVEVIMP